MDKLKKVVLDVEKGILTIDGIELPHLSQFKLEYKSGHWVLTTEANFFKGGKNITTPSTP